MTTLKWSGFANSLSKLDNERTPGSNKASEEVKLAVQARAFINYPWLLDAYQFDSRKMLVGCFLLEEGLATDQASVRNFIDNEIDWDS
jgi:hypothetical protein